MILHRPRTGHSSLVATALATALLLGIPEGGALVPAAAAQAPAAQEPTDGWNSREALELVERGRRARAEARNHADLESYRARTEGHVYFYVDPDDGGQRILLRVDQVAVDHFWRAPGESHQVVVGQRSETKAPIRDFNYFLDRLTLVQYGLGDTIEVGHGSDVADVPHPLAVHEPLEAPEERYDYRVSDSLRVSLPGAEAPIEIRRLDVRPRDPERPGFVGSVDVEKGTGSIVRMSFTVTPASYQDPRNDRVRVHLDYGLWEGRHWLPHEQRIEVRREMPQVDLGAGTVIESVLRVGGYEFDVPVDHVFRSPWSTTPVSFRPEEERRAFDFGEGLLDRLEDEGLEGARTVDPAEIRKLAREAGRARMRSGLPRARLHLPDLSTAVRYNRFEGWALGAGATFWPHASVRVRGRGGYAFEAGHPVGGMGVRLDPGRRWRAELSGRFRELEDLGAAPGSPGLFNTITAATGLRDDLDPYLRSGAGLTLVRPSEGRESRLAVGLEVRRDRSAWRGREGPPLDGDGEHRAVRPVEEGDAVALTASRTSHRPWKWGWHLRTHAGAEAVRFEGIHYGRLRAEGRISRTLWEGGGEVMARFRGGTATGAAPLQGHVLVGGRGTLPGYGYREMAARHFALLDLAVSRSLLRPWLGARLSGGAGWAGGAPDRVKDAWDAASSRGVLPTLGAGVAVYRDLVRVDVHRGLRDGRWTLDVSVDPVWWDRL